MRNETGVDEKVSQRTEVASQADQPEVTDVEFPYNYCLESTQSPEARAILIAMDALHGQLVVNASLLREIIARGEVRDQTPLGFVPR